MTPVGRWSSVLLGTLLLVATPAVVRSLPADRSGVPAGELLAQVRAADDLAWSGYVETEGTLQLPDADRFGDVTSLLGESTRLRAWWRDDEHWRVARLLSSGETDLVRRGDLLVEWDYERSEVTLSRDPAVRLPRAADLLPPALAARVLSGADPDDVTRVPDIRVAGRSAPGLRVRPASPLSSIDHADVWVDPGTGLPLRVSVHATGSGPAAFTSTLREVSTGPVTDEVLTTPEEAPGARLERDGVLDIADAANQYAPVRPPPSLAGLSMTAASDRAVGIYGGGMTLLVAVPLRDREAGPLREQLAGTPGAALTPGRTLVTVGPLGVLLTGEGGSGGWLLAGTLTPAGLDRAADDLLAGARFVGDR